MHRTYKSYFDSTNYGSYNRPGYGRDSRPYHDPNL
jgi:hypothetical protein